MSPGTTDSRPEYQRTKKKKQKKKWRQRAQANSTDPHNTNSVSAEGGGVPPAAALGAT